MVAWMKRNETTIEKGSRSLIDAECAEIGDYSVGLVHHRGRRRRRV
jgi:hypothetical protein